MKYHEHTHTDETIEHGYYKQCPFSTKGERKLLKDSKHKLGNCYLAIWE